MHTPDKAPFSLEFNWKISLFTILLLPLLVGLGFWQLQRAGEKSTIQQTLEEQQALPPLELSGASTPLLAPFRRVVFSGKPDASRIWLVENQVYQGQLGYHLLVPVELQDGAWVLVNGGWIRGARDRLQLPNIPPLPHSATFSGQLRDISHNRFLRAQTLDSGWPKRILQIDLSEMGKVMGDRRLLPWVVQLDETSPMAQTVHWPVINTSVDKHIGYALQWFAMAAALVILWVFANTNLGRRRKDKQQEEIKGDGP